MLSTNTVPLSSQITDRTQVIDSQVATDPKSSSVAPVEGVKVSLSGEGLKKSSDEKSANPNQDIEESGLPDQTQKLLKMIR
ncbi:hypothetical protein D3C81_2108780 [compost metagenome]